MIGIFIKNISKMRRIRLNEGQFNQLVAKCVKKALNEYGETAKGQYALGALQARKSMKKDFNGANDVYDFAERKRRKQGEADDYEDYGTSKMKTNPLYKSYSQGFCDHRDNGYRNGGKW